jgi:protein-L-isoaspartate O-methyltransferase
MRAEEFEVVRRRMLAEISAHAVQLLKTGGKLVIPTGLPDAQTLILIEKPRNGGITTKEILPVRFSQLESAEAA